MSPLPKDLVQYVARNLIERSLSIKINPELIREISNHPLPTADFQSLGLSAPLEQWRVLSSGLPPKSLWQKLNPFHQKMPCFTQNELLTVNHEPRADLVFAPLTLDGVDNMLDKLSVLPHWLSDNGVLLLAILGAGGLPEIVNAQTEWLDLLGHWPNIMNAGARLQELRFELPVLDVETVALNYADFDVLWTDILIFVPALTAMVNEEQMVWKNRLRQLFEQGLRAISLEVIYIQVWQVSALRYNNGTHTVSLESLTAQLPHRKTFGK